MTVTGLLSGLGREMADFSLILESPSDMIARLEYSSIVGYDGEPAQIMFAHVRRSDNYRTSIFDSLAIQLGHIK